MKYCGIDLHSNNSVISVIDDADRVLAERRLSNDLTNILMFLSPWREEIAGVVVESTFNWYWLVDGLQAAGFTVHLANTTAIKKYDGLKQSGDETDARYLAQLLRLGILPTGTILPPQQRAVRDRPGSASNWCEAAASTFSRSRTLRRVSMASVLPATRSSD